MLLCDFLIAASEPVRLELRDGTLESYRFSLSGPDLGFAPQAVIRVDRRANPELADPWVRTHPDLGGPAPNLFRITVHRAGADGRPKSFACELGETHWRSLKRLLQAAEFWELPTDWGSGGGFGGMAFYKIEGVIGDRSHVVRRTSPSERDSESFDLPCQYISDLARLAELDRQPEHKFADVGQDV